MFRLSQPIVKNANIQWKVIDKRAVLLNIDEAIVLKLDEIATQVWLAIDGKKSSNEIVDYITENFVVERARAQKDIIELLKQLTRSDAISIVK